MSGTHSSGELARLYGAWPGMQPVLDLGRLCLQLGRVTRATYHEDGRRRETDTDHTVMLSCIACSVAQVVAPHLDLGLVSQFAQVHDFVEVHAGDTVTLGGHAAADKAAREAAALDRIRVDFSALPWLPQMITRYESLADPEARFVKVLDKVMPCITHLLNGGVTIRELGLGGRLAELHRVQRDTIASTYGSDQPWAMELLREIHAMLDEMMAR